MKLLLLGSTLLLLLLLALSDGVLGGGEKTGAATKTNLRDRPKTVTGKSQRNGFQKRFHSATTVMWKQPKYLANTDTVIVKYTNIFLTAKKRGQIQGKCRRGCLD
jgi:hypothetical protein